MCIRDRYSPGHHKHQTGLYWGLTRVNSRDYFHNPSTKYWRKKSATIVKRSDEKVEWETIYEMLNKEGESLMTETQSWVMSITDNGEIILDLDWKGYASTHQTKCRARPSMARQQRAEPARAQAGP